MQNFLSLSPDYPLTLVSREPEMVQASTVAAENEHVRGFFHALMHYGYFGLDINGKSVLLDSHESVDMAYRLFLVLPESARAYRVGQAEKFFREGKIAA